jgi:HTH-type transcriptional regulator/antitoxin MqsA
MTTTECGVCGGEATFIVECRQVHVGARSAVVEDQFHRCRACGEEFYEPGQADAVMMRATTSIRAELGLLMPDEIRALRESLALSQADFERLLGVGKKTVVRWEKGTVFQNQATDGLLRAVRDVPGVAEYLGLRAGIRVAAPRE